MKVSIYNQQGSKKSETLLPKEIFEVPLNPDLVHQVVVSQMANQRKRIAQTKDRSEVRGGGKKPWRQKGTGRARHGSRRSPIWRGGGITFGPTKDKVFKKKINKKVRRKALFMVLSEKIKNNLVVVLDEIKIGGQSKGKASQPDSDRPKVKLTKPMAEILKKLPCKKESSLIALPAIDENIILAARNIPKIKTIQAKDLNVLDLLSFKYLITTKEGIKVIRETFLKKSKIQSTNDKSISKPKAQED